MKSVVLLFVILPLIGFAQELQYQLEPGAFPVEIDGWQPYCPWAGGMDVTTPELCYLDGDGGWDYFSGSYYNYYWYFENAGTQYTPNFQYISSTTTVPLRI